MHYRKLDLTTIPVGPLLKAALRETTHSQDSSRGVGAVIYDSRFEMIARDHNRLPRGIDANEKRLSAPGKYMWLVHAERACIATCNRLNKLHDAYGMVVTLHPCENCAQAIIDFGLRQLITRRPVLSNQVDEKWRASYEVAKEMLEESKVQVLTYAHQVDRSFRKRVNAPKFKAPPTPQQNLFASDNVVNLKSKRRRKDAD